MANLSLRLNPADVLLVATSDQVRELTEYGTETRQKRAGANLIQFSALVVSAGSTLGVVPVSTSERDLEALTSGLMLTVSGLVEATFSGTDSNYGLRTTLYAQLVEPTPANGWAALAETVRRATQQATK